ncbi:SMC family ATPase [Georgenia wangjunii]|uniref:SMC family ATPase n=1 Tax=Georgenia wangjunii TaxID=3117730 RepID=UPI002F25FE04
MRIHRLTLQAIGPFPDRHEVDVDRLAAGGLFLLEGPTGAGKSTLIDATVFALYGSIASSETSEDRLPSAHAGPDVEPFVDLTFSTGSGIHRVRRTPKHERPKRRGSGVTTQNATAKLWRLGSVEDEAGEPLAATTQEVGTEIGRIVGLDRSQFTQTVVLPQGRFAAFLRAKPEERRTLLQEVFGTEVYERVQSQLAAQARDARVELARAAEEIRTAAAGFAQAAGLGEEERAGLEDAARELDGPGLGGAADAACTEAAARAERGAEQEGAARTEERAAQAGLDAAADLAARLARRSALLGEEHALSELRPAVARATEHLARARRAAGTTASLRAHTEAAARSRAAREAFAVRLAEVSVGEHAALAELVPPDGAARSHLAALRAAAQDAAGERGALSDVLDVEAGLAGRATRLAAAQAACTAERAALDTRAEVCAARPAERASLVARAAEVHGLATEVSGARAAHGQAEALLATARRWAARAQEHQRAREVHGAAVIAARKAQQGEHEVRLRWIAGLAGALAAELEDAEPCPVCGSPDHPEPATPTPEHASDAEVEAATAARTAADAALTAAHATEAALRREVETLREAAGERDVATAAAELTAAAEALARAEAAAAELASLEAELAGFDARTTELERALADARTALATREAEVAAQAEHLERDRGHCAHARGDERSVAARSDGLARYISAAHHLADALEEHLAAERAVTEAEAALARTLAECGFPGAEEARAAALDAATVAALEREVDDHRAHTARVAAGLAEEPIAALTGTETSDVPAAALAHGEAQERLTSATREAAQARECAERAARARETLRAALAAHEERTAAAAPLVRMANLATAAEGNASATTLATFVLLRRFEDVVAAANERLAAMSDGRYRLERIDEREGGQRSRKAGLGLQVRDHVTERARDPHTLSGGETFYVSLCLALGLADVVTSESGGIALDTLFIDEGFGSLDPETLDDVMSELGRLHAGGRAVGIVSHVSELKSRIAERIEVRRLPSGASTLTVRC